MAERNILLASAVMALALVVCTEPAAAKPPGHLVPFPEDAAEASSPQTQPAKPRPPKSNFKPRFRVPDVKQAEHLEPATESVADEEPTSAGPQLLSDDEDAGGDDVGGDAEPAATGVQGRDALDLAYARSKTAKSEDEYTEVIDLCRSAKRGELSQKFADYADQLTGWAFNRRGETRAKAGQAADALADFEAAVAANGAWRAIHNRGVSYAAVGRLEEAMADFNRAIQLNPRYAHAYFNRGELRYKQDDCQGAIQDYTLAIKLGSKEAALFTSRGHAYYKMQRFGDALRDYGEAIKHDPENVAALINRGDTYSDVGKYGEAAKDYRAAVRLDPKSGRAFQAVAWLMATCPDMHYRDDKLAVDAAKKAIELDGPSFRNLSTLAAAQAAAGLFDEAQETQEQAIAAAAKDDVVTAEKMLSLYQREIPFRDRPFTAFKTPEEMDEEEVRQASANEPVGPNQQPPAARRAWFQESPPAQGRMQAPPQQLPPSRYPPQYAPQPQTPPQPRKARLFSPRGRI